MFLINGYSPRRSNKTGFEGWRVAANPTKRVLWSEILILSGNPGKFTNTSVWPFFEPFK